MSLDGELAAKKIGHSYNVDFALKRFLCVAKFK